MRLTINIPDELHCELKAQAAAEERILREIVLERIERGLALKAARFPITASKRKEQVD